MFENVNITIEFLAIIIVAYLVLLLSITKLGTYKSCGGMRAFIVGLLLTPVIGIVYVILSPEKSTLKIVHYRCNSCGLEYTTQHKHCPSCLKEGEKHRLERISMRTY